MDLKIQERVPFRPPNVYIEAMSVVVLDRMLSFRDNDGNEEMLLLNDAKDQLYILGAEDGLLNQLLLE